MDTNNNISKEFDFKQIKSHLNASMEEDDISVSEDLIAKTMNRIKQEDILEFSKVSQKSTRKNKYMFTNVAAVVLLVLVVGVGLVKGVSSDYLSDSDSKVAEEKAYEEYNDAEYYETEVGDYIEEADESGEVVTGLILSDVIDLDFSNIEILEVSYYEDNDDVINRDLTTNLEEVFALFSTYPLEEISPNEDGTWKYRFNVIPTSNEVMYTIIIGENINVIEEKWSFEESELDDSSQDVIRTFQVEEIESLKVQLEQIINSTN